MAWTDPAPVYVTRKDAEGLTGTYSISLWVSLLAMLLIFTNVIGWGFYLLYVLAGKVI